jgi:hypothetical protein
MKNSYFATLVVAVSVGLSGCVDNAKNDPNGIRFVPRLEPIGKVDPDMSPRQVELFCNGQAQKEYDRLYTERTSRGFSHVTAQRQAIKARDQEFAECASIRGYEMQVMIVQPGEPEYPDSYTKQPSSSKPN